VTLYKAYGNELVDNRTTVEMVASGRIAGFEREAAAAEPRHFGLTVPFTEVGIGKPLTVELRHIYTGQYPKGVFGYNDGMLVTSAIKSLSTFNAAPRAINYLRESAKKGTNLPAPAATEDGTPLMFYTPALTEKNTVLTIEIIFDNFPEALVQGVGSAFMAAASIPLFIDKSMPLLAAGAVIKLAGRLAEKLVDGRPAFSVTESLSFLRPGDDRPDEGFHLMTEDGFDLEAEGCEFDPDNGTLVYKSSGAAYDGPHPYVVFSLDGTENEDYELFTPTAASAALLKQFYHIGEGQQQPLDTLLDAVKLYNDWQFRTKADKAGKELAQLEQGSEAYDKKQAEYNAFVANILNESLRPK
jgi:hypothetical protein